MTVWEHFWYFDDVPQSDIQIELETKQRVKDKTVQNRCVNIEVKTTKPHTWNSYKRTVLPYQLKKYIKRDAVVVWTTTSPSDKDPEVELKGWNTAKEIQELGIVNASGNIWLKEDRHMRPMSTFLAFVNA